MDSLTYFGNCLTPALWTVLGLTAFHMIIHFLTSSAERIDPMYYDGEKSAWAVVDWMTLGACAVSSGSFLYFRHFQYDTVVTLDVFLLNHPTAIGMAAATLVYMISGLILRYIGSPAPGEFGGRWGGQHVLGIGLPCIIFFIQFAGP
jgi:hypothetical protein